MTRAGDDLHLTDPEQGIVWSPFEFARCFGCGRVE